MMNHQIKVHTSGCSRCEATVTHYQAFLDVSRAVNPSPGQLVVSGEATEIFTLKKLLLTSGFLSSSLDYGSDLIAEVLPRYLQYFPKSDVTNLSPEQENEGTTTSDYITEVAQLIPLLSPELRCQNPHLVPAWTVGVKEGSILSKLILLLEAVVPKDQQLLHLKRVGPNRHDSAGYKFCLHIRAAFGKTDISDVFGKLQRLSGSDVTEPFISWVPFFAPLSKAQQTLFLTPPWCSLESSMLLGWPTKFHPDIQLEKLINHGKPDATKPLFSEEETKRHNSLLSRVVVLAGRSTGGTTSSCLDILEKCDRLRGMAILVVRGNSEEVICSNQGGPKPYHHPIMQAACVAGNIQLADLKEKGSTADYLFTDFDVYLSDEPCLMCAMALVHSRVKRVFIARRLPAMGGFTTYPTPLNCMKQLNHRFQVFIPPK